MREEVAAHYRAKGYTIRERVQVRGTSGAVHSVEMVAQGPLGNLVVAFEDAGGFEGPELGAVRRIARDIGATPVVAARRFDERLRVHAARSGVVLLDDAALHAPAPAAPPAADELDYPPWPDPSIARQAREQTPWPGVGRQVVQGAMDASPIDAVVDDWTRPVRPSKSTDPGFWRYPRAGQGQAPEGKSGGLADAAGAPAVVKQGSHAGGRAPAPSGEGASTGRTLTAPRPSFDWLASPADAGPRAASRAARARPSTAGTADPGAPQAGTRGRPAAVSAAPPATSRTPANVAPWTRWAAIGAGFGASAAVVFYALLRLLG